MSVFPEKYIIMYSFYFWCFVINNVDKCQIYCLYDLKFGFVNASLFLFALCLFKMFLCKFGGGRKASLYNYVFLVFQNT